MGNERKWLKYYPDEIPVHIEYRNEPLHAFLKESAERYQKKKALYFMGKRMSFATLYEEVRKMANYMQHLGLKKADRVSIMLPNCPQAVISYYAVLLAGAIVVQTNPLYKERELKYQLKHAEAEFIICLDVLFPLVTKVREQTSIKHTIVTGIKDYLPFPKNIAYPFIQKKEYNMVVKMEQSEETHIWQQMMKKSSIDYKKVEVDTKRDIALLQYTGGTTGNPKGVMLTHYNLVANVEMCKAWLYKMNKEREKILGVLPFFHVYGMTTVMNMGIFIGAEVILLPKFEAGEVLKTIQKTKPTLFPGAPTIYVGLLNHPDFKKYNLSSIEACISGSAPLPIEVQEQFETATGGKLVEGYGLTETSPVTHANFLWGNRVNGSIGVPWPDTEAKIVDMETLEELPEDEIGEIAIKGPQVMKGYWNAPEETASVLKGEWLYTNDLGYRDKHGYFYIVDRKGDMIIAGGYNIYPREIEEVLYEHEDILEVVVAGVPDAYRGETVKAYIVLKSNVSLTKEELDGYCKENLAAYKVPKQYEFRNELPKTAVGKILRRQLVDEEMKKQQNKKTSSI